MAGRLGRSAVMRLWAQVARRPIDSAAVLAAVAGCLVIMVNALFLQSRSLPVPVPVAALPRPLINQNLPKSNHVSASTAAPTHTVGVIRKPAHVAIAPRHDAIAKLIDEASQIIAVQRALSDYGYGQLKPSGILDRPTRDAIERFEREHNIPVTGKVSERLVNELAVLIGHPLE
jgi:hypothetical protein